MADVLQVESRELFGKQNNRRLRQCGKLPAILYGHGMVPVSLSLSEDQINASLRHGAKVVDLAGAEQGQALLQDVQWDTFQQFVLHVDLLRVEQGDRVKIEIPLVLRGESPGTHDGGVVEQLLRSIELEVPPSSVPEHLNISINDLQINCSLTAGDIDELPEGATLLTDASQVCVQCNTPQAERDDSEASDGVNVHEPEIIGRKSDDEAGE